MIPVLAIIGCVDLSPPWKLGQARDSSAGGAGGGDPSQPQADVYSPLGTGGAGGGTSDPAGTSGGGGGGGERLGGTTATGDQGSGGVTGLIDSSLSNDGQGDLGVALDTGSGGTTGDAEIDAPLGGTGGSAPDSAIDANTTNTGGQGAFGSGGSGSGGSATGGSATGGSTSGGSATGGSCTGGAGGIGTGGTGGSGTGGATVSTSGLLIYDACDQTSGSTLTDTSGNSRNATLVTGTGGTAGYSFGAGKVNNALHLVKASQGNATIANTGLGAATEMTVAAWVYLNTSVEWQRVWDFGNSTTTYMFLSPKSSVTKFIRFAITTSGLSGEQGLDGTAELTIGVWKHVAVVMGGGTGILYVDGQVMTTKTGMTLLPSALGSTTNNHLGKSQYSDTTEKDPYLDGNIDEFRVYSRILTPAEIAILAGK